MFLYKRIFVAVDGSREADYAFDKAMSIAKRNPGSTLTAVHVLDKSYRMGVAEVADHNFLSETVELSEKLIAYYNEKARAFGVECDVQLKEGAPASVLLKEVKGLQPHDLVICGSSNLGRITRLIFGSVSNTLVNEAACDVLVVRTPEARLVE